MTEWKEEDTVFETVPKCCTMVPMFQKNCFIIVCSFTCSDGTKSSVTSNVAISCESTTDISDDGTGLSVSIRKKIKKLRLKCINSNDDKIIYIYMLYNVCTLQDVDSYKF